MWQSKKSVIVTLLGAVVLVVSSVGAGCASTGNGGEGLPDMPNSTGNGGEGLLGMSNNILARVAEILGIDQQRVEDAFTQAQTEIQNATQGDRSPEAIIARTAEILEVEQQDLQDAFTQAQSEMADEAPWQRPSDGNRTPWGANEE
jgi:hypothetical protein